jgi:pimeloyl-ACP methyl ester carboxylesterase
MPAIVRPVDFGTGRWIDAGKARLFTRIWGDDAGRDVLCWHGVGLASRASLDFAGAAPQLVGGHGLRVLALDAPGFGESPAVEREGYHPHALADLVPLVLDTVGVDRAAFVGFSWGGDVGCHVAARHAERLTALVVLDAGYWDPPFDPQLPYEEYLARNDALARTTHRVVVAPSVVAAVEHGTSQAPPSTTWPRLAASSLPVLLVAQARASDADLERFASAVPEAELLRPACVGHDVLGDGGAEVVRAVGDWLRARAAET